MIFELVELVFSSSLPLPLILEMPVWIFRFSTVIVPLDGFDGDVDGVLASFVLDRVEIFAAYRSRYLIEALDVSSRARL